MKKMKALKIILIVIGIIVIGFAGYSGISYFVMTGSLVDNGWNSSAEYVAEVTTRGVPKKYEAECIERGSVVGFKYTVELYTDASKAVEKHAYVYLPAGYDETEQYDVLYLYHGGGESEAQWFGDNPTNQNVVDNLIFYGDIDPLIIVMPNLYYPENFGFKGNRDFQQLAYELRHNLIPAVESTYSTFAAGDTSENNLIATRDHRAMAGLSMGGRHTINSGMMKSLDIISWFGDFSSVDDTAEQISAAIHSEEFEQYQINYLLATTGKYDMIPGGQKRYEVITSTMSELDRIDEKISQGENYSLIDVINGGHNMATWEVSLYDFLQIIFK